MDKIRIALAKDNMLLREGISRLIGARDDFELVGVAADLPQLLALIEQHVPDVVVTDIRMPPTGTDDGIQAAAWLRTGVTVNERHFLDGEMVRDQRVQTRCRQGELLRSLGENRALS